MSGYPIWWMGAGVPTLTWDMGAFYPINVITVWMYSTAGDPRATKFILQFILGNCCGLVCKYNGSTCRRMGICSSI
jgi:hypothetical protein